jgi:hypothetical protein
LVFDGDCGMVVVFGVAKICNSIRSLASLATVQGPFALISLACFTGPLFMILLIDTDTNHLRTHLWAYQNPSGEILVVNQYEGTTEGFEHCSLFIWVRCLQSCCVEHEFGLLSPYSSGHAVIKSEHVQHHLISFTL